MRPCPPELEAAYAAAVACTSANPPVDICEHLPLLRQLASECEHVTEIGMRWANGSTIALLAAQPKTFISWDINPLTVVSQPVADLVAMAYGSRTKFQPRVGDSLEIIIEPTDMLFIDSLHVFEQLKSELVRHADPVEGKVREYLVFHDTETFGRVGEDGSTPGLRAALHWFQTKHAFPLWHLLHDNTNNNGLACFQRVRAR